MSIEIKPLDLIIVIIAIIILGLNIYKYGEFKAYTEMAKEKVDEVIQEVKNE